jgi:hypothetical protein
MVNPTMSGNTIDRRDQVRIGRFSFVATAVSTFFIRCMSTKGPL